MSDGSLANRRANLVVRQHLAAQELLDQFVVHLGCGFDHLLAPFGRLIQHLCRAIHLRWLLAESVLKKVALQSDEINNTLEFGFRANRKLDGNGIRTQAVAHLPDNRQEVRAPICPSY